ncbi:MAG: ComF family protein [Syntrophorhabdaceae bacterium]|nr:ComF family protein [Syntrophorhabdaceae bacterium]
MPPNISIIFKDALQSLLNSVYPVKCGGCGKSGGALCNDCIDSFQRIDENTSCPICGRGMGIRSVCGECIKDERGFIEGRYGFFYEKNLREAIHAFKFHGRKDVGRALTNLLSEKIKGLSSTVDLIIPIPVTEKRLKERGFNPSFIISQVISEIIKKPVLPTVLIKGKETLDQSRLDREERLRNIKGAFSVKDGERIKGKRVLIVDDLFTTGATAREASYTLKKRGIDRLYFFALARAMT